MYCNSCCGIPISTLADSVGYHVTRENGPIENRAILAGCETILSSKIALFR